MQDEIKDKFEKMRQMQAITNKLVYVLTKRVMDLTTRIDEIEKQGGI